jgi:hypothetical protein
MVIQAQTGKKQDPISKIFKTKRAGGMVQVAECLPSKCEAVSSNPSTAKKKKKKGNRGQGCPFPDIKQLSSVRK